MTGRRQNPITPIARLLVGREDAADLLSMSVSKFDQLVKDGALPKAHIRDMGNPLWYVAKLEDDIRGRIAGYSESEDDGYVFPESSL